MCLFSQEHKFKFSKTNISGSMFYSSKKKLLGNEPENGHITMGSSETNLSGSMSRSRNDTTKSTFLICPIEFGFKSDVSILL